METDVTFLNDIVDIKSNLPLPHLSFIIQFLLPKRLVGFDRVERQVRSFKEVGAKDPLLADGFFNPIMVGSVAEGYNIPDVILRSNPFGIETNADADILLSIPGLSISTELIATKSSERSKLLLDTQDTHEGYARIQIPTPTDDDDTFVFLEESNKTFLSGMKLQRKIFSSLDPENLMLHGPAISTNTPTMPSINEILNKTKRAIHSNDYVCALPCSEWPTVAKQWIDRQKRGEWLDQTIIDQIVDMGIHLVPVPHKNSLQPDLEWRISFATSETFLAKEVITDDQRQCYVFLKITHFMTLKRLNILSSYHMKTIFLYCCEKLPVDAWKESPGACLLFMIDVLIDCVSKKCLPSYFIPENNLIDHCTDDQLNQVKDILESVRENPLKPVLEFTDTRIMGLQSLSTPFRDIISPVMEDAIEFLVHRDVQKSVMTGFLSALFKIVYVLIIETKPEEAVKNILDVFPFINKYTSGSVSVAQIVDSIVMNFIPDVKLTVSILEEVLKYSDEHPDVLMLRGNLACMFHALAYKHPEDSEDRLLALVQAETLFNTVVDVEDEYSATAVDYSCLLIKQDRFEEASEKLDRFIAAEINRSGTTHCFYNKEVLVLDDTLQKEVNVHGKLSVNSLSMAYYLLLRCVVKNELSSADPAIYGKILQYFNDHCMKVDTSESYCLLGYCQMLVKDWVAAEKAFIKALETCQGSVRLIKDNMDRCKKQLHAA